MAGFDWAFGEEREPTEPTRPLLPGRIDAPAALPVERWSGCHIVATFSSQEAAASLAAVTGGLVVGCTAIVADVPRVDDEEPNFGTDIRPTMYEQGRELVAAGGSVFVCNEWNGYHTVVDIRATAPDETRARLIARQLAFGRVPVEGLREPWAPGVRLSEEVVEARLFAYRMYREEGLAQPATDVERAVAALWEPGSMWPRDYVKLRPLLGSYEREEVHDYWQSDWLAQYELQVQGRDVCIGGMWSLRLPNAVPAVVRWLRDCGVERAVYDICNLARP